MPIFGFAQCICGDCYNGQGTFIFDNKDVYAGEYKYGKKHGQGTYIWASGTIYTGEWKDGEEHGQGTCIWSSGTIYAGEWKDGKKHGKGYKNDASGSVHEGFWVNDLLIQREDVPQYEEKIIDYVTNFEDEEANDEFFIIVEEMPRFQGCADDQCTQMEIMKYIAKNTKYPQFAKDNNITGRVFVSFVVDKTGKITQVKALRGVDKYLDAEAIRVVQSMPKFKPGKQKGKYVNVQYSVPINFRLTDPIEEN